MSNIASIFVLQKWSVEMLLKRRADPTIPDSLGSRPSAYTSDNDIRALLITAERKFVGFRIVVIYPTQILNNYY